MGICRVRLTYLMLWKYTLAGIGAAVSAYCL